MMASIQSSGKFQPLDYVKITIFGFALSVLWGSMHYLIMPLRVLDFVPEALKNTYLDLLILAGSILAIMVQPIAGAISDHSNFRWGRRRPYIVLGTILSVLSLSGIGFVTSYASISITYLLLQVSSNIAEGPYRAFFPDLVPVDRRGAASGVRNLLNTLAVIAIMPLTGFFMERHLASEEGPWLWLALVAPAAVLLVTMLATILMVKEQAGVRSSQLPFTLAPSRNFKIDVGGRPDFILFLAGCFLAFLAWSLLTGHVLYYLMDVVGITQPAKVTGDFLIVVGISTLAITYPAGHLSDRVGRKPIAVCSVALGALGAIALFFSQSYMHIMLSGGLLGVSGGAWMSSQWAIATDLVEKGHEARDLGLVNISSAGAGALSRFAGPVIDFLNAYRHNLGYQFMILACVISLVAASLLLMKIKTRASQVVKMP